MATSIVECSWQVPNAIGFLLGSAQLILYVVYRKKSGVSTKEATEKEVEEGSAHLVEMTPYNDEDDDKDGDGGRSRVRSLVKGRSLPNSHEWGQARQLSLQKIVRMQSMSPHELHFK